LLGIGTVDVVAVKEVIVICGRGRAGVVCRLIIVKVYEVPALWRWAPRRPTGHGALVVSGGKLSVKRRREGGGERVPSRYMRGVGRQMTEYDVGLARGRGWVRMRNGEG
jgi:hypothetical protein